MIDLKRIYAEFLQSEQDKRNKKYEKYEGWLGASSSGHCFKKQYYKLHNVESQDAERRVNRLLRLGTIVHSDIEKAIKAYNKTHKTTIKTEKQIKIPELKVIGHIDILETTDEVNKIYDIKTVASYKWRMKFGRKGTDPNSDINYSLQLGTYGLGVKKINDLDTELYLCWYNKDNSSMKEPLQVDSEWIYLAENYWEDLWKSINEWNKQSIAPDDIETNIMYQSPIQEWECNYCQYAYRCNSPYIKNKQNNLKL